MRGEAVAQRVRAELFGDSGLGEVLVELASDGSIGNALSGPINEQRPGGRLAKGFLTLDQVGLNGRQRATAQRRQSLLLALALNPKGLAELVKILDVQADQFTNSQPGGVDGFENGAVTGAQEGSDVRG